MQISVFGLTFLIVHCGYVAYYSRWDGCNSMSGRYFHKKVLKWGEGSNIKAVKATTHGKSFNQGEDVTIAGVRKDTWWKFLGNHCHRFTDQKWWKVLLPKQKAKRR